MVKGLDVFASYFAGDEAHYILIGGVATQLVLEEAGLPARATKDLDIVLCVEVMDAAFGEKLWRFVKSGGYAIREHGAESRQFYRFQRPADSSYPQMLEFFARAPAGLTLAVGAHLTPVPIDVEVESLSAILLDEGYYDFLHARTRELGGVRIVTEQGLIPLKARAWLDLAQRRAADRGSVDGKQLAKHRNDVLRLSQLLSEGERIDAPASISADLAKFLEAIANDLSDDHLRVLNITESPDALLARIRAAYRALA